jgi:acyl-CoA oxidase
MPALATTYALHFAQQRLISDYDSAMSDRERDEEEQRKLESFAAGLKAMSTWHATETIQTCRECCGGQGYIAANRFAALKADTDVFTTFEGDNTVLLQLVGKSLLTNYRDHFGDLNPIGVVGFVAGQVFETVVERTAVRELVGRVRDDLMPNREGDDSIVRHREYQLELFRWREDHIVQSVARRLKRGVDSDMDPYEVFMLVQDHVVSAARAHVERIVLEAFADAVERCEESPHGAALNRLCDLYALSAVERDRGWFQEHGRISSTRSKAVTREVNSLCRELRQQAGQLVDAFGIPDAVLGAPIGLREGAHAAFGD